MGFLTGRQFLQNIYTALYEWNEDKAPRMAAAVAFYTVFSLTPIVVIAFKMAEISFGHDVALNEILAQAAFLIGKEGADGIKLLIENAPPRQTSGVATLLGLAVMVFATTGVFTELKDALSTIWEVQPKPGLSFFVLARDRLFAFAMVLVIWFLMLVSLMMSAALTGVRRFVGLDVAGLQLAESVISLLLTTLLFALIYRILPDVTVAWRDVWLGAAVTAVLFAVGKALFGLYLGHSTLGSSYGAAGSLIIIILWTYCSCLMLLFGAEMTQVHARLRHARIVPSDKAVHVTEHDRVQQGIPRTEDIELAANTEERDRSFEFRGGAHPVDQTRLPLRSAAVAVSAAAMLAAWVLWGRKHLRLPPPHRRRTALGVVITILSLSRTVASDEMARPEQFWPVWRGPLATGVAPHGDPPVEWSETENVRWKIELPGLGHSTPVIWGDRVFVTTAVPTGEPLERPIHSTAPGTHDGVPVTHRQQFTVLAIDRKDGTILWQNVLREELPHEGGHYTASLASSSPATDGEHLYAFFGSYGLYCLDLDGNLVWQRDFGKMQSLHGHGEGSSPALHGDTLVVNWDHEGQSFVVALDKATGKEKWSVDRAEITSWASPIVVEHDGKPQLIISGTNRVRGYDLATGQEIWQCAGLSANVVASPVAADGMVFAASSYDKKAMLAIRLEAAHGDITGTDRVAWTRIRGTPYVPSPLLYGNSLYFLNHYQGILTRADVHTGADQHGPFRLVGLRDIYASPVAAAGRVYVTDRSGITLVLSHDDDPKIIAANRLNDRISASAAIVASEIYFRGERHLYCISRDE
jgi:YihY family inner membrane protein